MKEFTSALADCAADVVQRVKRSLVVLHNGRHGMGAGIIWGAAPAGGTLILTNYHVIAHGRDLRAELEDGRIYPTRPVAREPEFDLALLEIEARNLPAALIADSHALRVGELVMAVGHPWGQRSMVTLGLVSGLSKVETTSHREIDIIRSDASLAPGNSGGPLVNASGGVIGINTMIVGGDQGVAVPSHVARLFVEGALEKI